ncbi:uncharacterized protein LOC119271878 [Triticum dicoccoides]|uniref:uncharacterized protein LOC119271878 n=1 Tax=Triticum dicoccoides TaxID=85692 RepID=UPI0003D58AD1|nr:uncharacterized protein LOC119271878 [Triticum dicoccoides]XP_044338664.1 uncharacterized protein LOC123060152 isoform X2 [Triticum aestivum]
MSWTHMYLSSHRTRLLSFPLVPFDPLPPSPRKAGGAMVETAWELAELFVLRPVLAISFALSFILLSWYVAWRTVLVHVPLVQEVAGLRPKKKPAKPKPPNRGRIGRFYQSQAEAQRDTKLEGTS